ncbi:MAG: queuosine precursor transporter [Planctomycetota bacterium]
MSDPLPPPPTGASADPFGDLPPLDPATLARRRERVFLIMAGLFLGTLTMLNILGVTRFIRLGSVEMGSGDAAWQLTFAVAVGVLPYPLTFLCTDLISEFYGRRRANFLVWVGLILNLWVLFVLWLGGALPGFEALTQGGALPRDEAGRLPLFYEVRQATLAAMGASMIAYLAAQFVDVQVFHFWKRLTKGKHLWLRNNGSTLISQLIDSVAVILITYLTFNVLNPDSPQGLPIDRGDGAQPVWFQLAVGFILAGYVFKLVAALVDTPVIYLAVRWLTPYLRIDPRQEHHVDDEDADLFGAVRTRS